MDHNIESIDQAQRAQMLTNGEDPSQTIPFFRQTSPIGDLVDQQYRASQKHSPIWPIYSVPPAITAPTLVNHEKDKLTKMKQRKEARKERAEKKVKTVIVDGDRETPYDFEKVLLELGEADSNKKANSSSNNNSGAKGKKAKVERKRSKNNTTTNSKNKDQIVANSSSNDATKETTPASSGRSSEDEDEEDEVKITNSKFEFRNNTNSNNSKLTVDSNSLLSSAVENMPEFLSGGANNNNSSSNNNSSVINNNSSSSSSNNISGVNLTRQTSRSTEDLFTPVIKKQNRWKNKKVSALTTKDDSGHTYSSTSSASSTTSSSAMTNNTANDKSRPYNLRRKSALRPSQSFDTMKSTTSSVVSDGDTMEAAASRTSTKDQLDLASDFPPLMAAAPSIGEIEPPKWVTPAAFKSSNTQAPCNMDSQNNVTATTTNTLSSAAHLTSSSSTAVIDASDDSKNNQQIIAQSLCIGPPPDVTVGANCQQNIKCTSTGLPDVAAQAPFFMNTANSSSGVSSNAGDLTPPQTSVSEQSFFTLGEDQEESGFQTGSGNSKTTSTPNNKHSEIKDNKTSGPAVVMFTGDGIGGKFQNSNAATFAADDNDGGDTTNNNQIEFGFEVNVLDFIGDSELNEDDNAIISFVPNKNNNSNTINVLDSPESGIDSMTSNITTDSNNAAAAIGCVIMQQNKIPQPSSPQEPLINEAVKIPNYTQVVQFVQRQWNQVQKELKQGLVYQF